MRFRVIFLGVLFYWGWWGKAVAQPGSMKGASDFQTHLLYSFGAGCLMVIIAILLWRYLSVKKLNAQLRRSVEEKLKTDQILKESEQRFRLLAENIHGVFWMSDPQQSKILYISPAYERIWKKSCQSLYENRVSYLEAIHPDDVAIAIESNEEQLQGKKTAIEYRIIPEDGEIRWIWDRGFPVQDGSEEVTCILGIAEDITEYKQAEEELRLNKQILDHMVEGVCLISREGNFLYVNPRYEQMFAYAPGELIGNHVGILDMSSDEGMPGQSNSTMMDLIENSAWNGEIQNIRKDGSTLWTRVKITTFEHSTLGVIWLVAQEDISDHKKAAETLKEAEEKYKTLIDNAPIAIFVAQDDRVKFVNMEMERLYGYPEGEITSKSFIHFIHPEDRALVLERHRRRLQGEKLPNTYSYRMVTQKGNIRWVEIKVVPFTWENRPATLCFQMDITEQRQLEIQLRQSQKMEALGTLAGGIAHDFNNILAAILSNAEMSMMEIPPDSKARDSLETVLKAGERAIELIKQILTFSRMESVTLKPLKLNLIVQDALKLVKSTIPANIEIRQHLPRNCHNIMADAIQIQQIVLNLCTNACHAMEETGGILEVTLQEINHAPAALGLKEESYLSLTVKDTGGGISPWNQERMFDPFFTTKEFGKGTGMGLSVVHGIIEQHQGRIAVDSEEGKGTTITTYFPVTSEKISEETQIGDPMKRGAGHILVIEDEEDISAAYQKFLEKQGYRVTVCNNGSEALSMFKDNPDQFSLILTDQAMPKMTGKQLAQELLTIRPGIPIILSTGYSDYISEKEAQAIGIRRYLIKPIRLKALQQNIEECL